MKKTFLIFCFLFFPSFVHAAVSEFYYSFDRPPKSLSTHYYDTASRAVSYNKGVLKLTIEQGMHGAKEDESKGVERAELIKEISFGKVNMSFKIRVGKNFEVTKRTMISQIVFFPNGYRSPIASVYLDKGGRVKCVSYTAEDQIQHIVPIKHVNITDGKWHKVLISVTPSYGSGKCSIFIDDKEVINVSDLTNIPNNSPKQFDTRIGVYRDAQPFSQTVYFDDWKLESIPIKTQIQKHFEKLDLESRKKFQSNLRGYGYASKLDGIWGNNTQIAVLKFIENNDETMSEKPREIVGRIVGRTKFTASGFGDYTETDWNETFYDNAGMPSSDSLKWINEGDRKFIRFRLKNGDIGRALTDNQERHSAPYWERAELKARHVFEKNKEYQIEFQARFLQGFNGRNETFFQVHQYNENCGDGPPLMLKFNHGRLRLDTLMNPNYGKYNISNVYIGKRYGKWQAVKIYLDTLHNRVTILIDGELIFSRLNFFTSKNCSPYMKFGIYRSGNVVTPNNLSIVDFDKIRTTEVKTIIQEEFELLNIDQRKKWQKKLRDFGFKGPPDGEWGRGMAASMRDLIEKHGHLERKDEYEIIRQITNYLN